MGGDTSFVKMSTNEPWLILSTTGQKKYNNSSFGRTSLLDNLHELVENACNGGEATFDVKGHEDDADYDPMNEIECEDTKEPVTRGRGVKRARYYKNAAKNRVLDVDVPDQPPEVVKDCRVKRSIQLYIIDRKQIWLRIDDVAWALKYLYIQNLLKGVPLLAPGSAGPSGSGIISDDSQPSSST